MVSFNELVFLAFVATSLSSTLAFPTSNDPTGPDLARRLAWPIQPQIFICKNNEAADDKAEPKWTDIRISTEAAECAVHAAPLANDITSYPHQFWNGIDPKNPTKYRFAPFKFQNDRCNKKGIKLLEFPIIAVRNTKTNRWNYPPYELNKRPRPDPGPVRVIFSAQDKEFCGVIAHERNNQGDFHLCKPVAEWEAQGWRHERGKAIAPTGPDTGKKRPPQEDRHLWFVDEKGPEAGWPAKHKREETGLSMLLRRAARPSSSCPLGVCPKGQATIGPKNKCQKCPPGKIPDLPQEKCVKCPSGETPNKDGDKCVKEEKCKKGEAKTGKDGACEKCPKDKEPTSDQKSCQNKCPSGQIRKNDNKCEKCPSGKKPDGDQRKCIDKTPAEKKKEEEEEKKRKEKELQEKKRSRVAKCLAFISSSSHFLNDEGHERLTDDEIADASDEWPEGVPYVEGDITEDNIEPPRAQVVMSGDMDAAGFGGVFKGIFEGLKRIFGGGGKKGGGAGGKTAKVTATLKKIRDNRSFRDCLMLTPTMIGGAYLHFDPPGGYEPIPDVEGSRPYLSIYTEEDNRGNGALVLRAHTDRKFHTDRLILNQCTNLHGSYHDSATGFDAHKICCAFYRDVNCKGLMFEALDRQDGELTGDENDVMSSFMCTSKADKCKDLPR